MGAFGVVDTVTWQALGLALTVVGLLASVVVWRRRGPVSGLRGVAWSLLPLAAGLTGVLQLLWRMGSLIAGWAVHVILSPLVWLGIVVAGVSVLLFGVTGVLRAKGVGRRRSGKETGGTAPAGSTATRRTAPATVAAAGKSPAGAGMASDDDMADVEAILKRHGIS